MNRFSSFIIVSMTALLLVIGCSGDTPPPASASGNTTSTENKLIAGSLSYVSDSGSDYAGVSTTADSSSSTSTASVIATSRSGGSELTLFEIINAIEAEPDFIANKPDASPTTTNDVSSWSYESSTYGKIVEESWDFVEDIDLRYAKNSTIKFTAADFTIELTIANMAITSTDAEMTITADITYTDSRIGTPVSYSLTETVNTNTGDYTVTINSLKIGDDEVVVSEDLKYMISNIVGGDVNIGGEKVTTSVSGSIASDDESTIISYLEKVTNGVASISIRSSNTDLELIINNLEVNSTTTVSVSELELTELSPGSYGTSTEDASCYKVDGELYINGTEYEVEDLIVKVDTANTITKVSGYVEADDNQTVDEE